MNILHLVSDEKFIQFVVEHLGRHSQATNRFVAIVDNANQPLKHISGIPVWRTVDKRYVLSPEMEEDLLWCDGLVVHYLTDLNARIILLSPSNITIIWSGWGRDYYSLLGNTMSSLLDLKTSKLSQPDNLLLKGKNVLRQIRKKILSDPKLVKAIERFDLFSAPIPEDYELLKLALGARFKANYIQLNYGSVEKTFMIGGTVITGQNILIGNSSTQENNHIEAFEMLSQYDLGDKKVIVTLSYGDIKYRDAVIFYGKKILGNNFHPLIEFTTLDNYNSIIASCSVVIMNHRRQQALGNIGTMLYKGAKVFLDKNNVVFKFFNKRGANVYSTEHLKEKYDEAFAPLNEIQKQQNRAVLEEFWSDKVVSDNYLKLINELNKRKQHSA